MIDYLALAKHLPEMFLMLGIVALVVGVSQGIQRVITSRDKDDE